MSAGRAWLAATLAILLLLSSLMMVYGQEGATLTVLVRDPLGNSLDGVEARLTRGEESRRFITNSTGYAEFKYLDPGEYLLEIILDNVTVGKRIVRIPEDREVEVTAQVGTIKLRLLNLDQEPVGGLAVELRAGTYSWSGRSNERGVVRVDRAPYSSLDGVGTYSLIIKLSDLVIYRGSLEVFEPEVSRNISLPLLNLGLTITNLRGEPVRRITVTVSSESYAAEERSETGSVFFKNLPSSSVEGVGPYRINASMRFEGGDMPIYFEERRILESQNISLVADLARLTVRVVDEDGEPVKGVRVILSNELAVNFTSSETDEGGEAVFENIPLSRGGVSAGEYHIRAVRAGRIVGELRAEFDKPDSTIELTVRRSEVRIRLLDYQGNPLSGYLVKLVDELTGDSLNATTNNLGEAALKLFHGPYSMEIYRGERLIRSSMIQLTSGYLEVKLDEVNFPLRIRVIDALGRIVTSGYVKIQAGDETLFEGRLGPEPISLILPYPAELRCDVYSDDGRLLHRELVQALGPQEVEVVLGDYVFLGGLVELESIATALTLGLVAACIALSIALLARARRKG